MENLNNQLLENCFKSLNFDNGYKPIDEKIKIDEFIKLCKESGGEIYLGSYTTKIRYSYFGVVYRQNIFDPYSKDLEYVYVGVSSSTDYKDDLFKRPTKDWYNIKIKYAGKKVEDIREKLLEREEYLCDTEIVHIICGNSEEDVQKALNILEPYYILEVPEYMRLNTAKGGGNYTKGRRVATEYSKYTPISGDEISEDTSFWAVTKEDLKHYRDYSSPVDFVEIKYNKLSEAGKEGIIDRSKKLHITVNNEKKECYIIDETSKEELENIRAILDKRKYNNRRNISCVYVNYGEDKHIDFNNSFGYKSIADCYRDSSLGCYSTARNYVKSNSYGYSETSEFVERFLNTNFNLDEED